APTRGEALCGALGQLSKIDAAIVAWQLLPRLVERSRLVPATAVETVATIVESVASGGHSVRGWEAAAQWVVKVRAMVARSGLAIEDAEYLSNALCAFAQFPTQLAGGTSTAAGEEAVKPALDVWTRCAAALGGADAQHVEEVAMTGDTERLPTREVA